MDGEIVLSESHPCALRSRSARVPAIIPALVALAALAVVLPGSARAQSFRTGATIPTGVHPNSIAVGDFNSDGLLDMAVPQYEPKGVTLFLGDGNGGFSVGASFPCGRPRASIAIDLNADGKLDVVVSDEAGSFVWVLIGNGAGGFSSTTSYPVGTTPYFVSAGDFDGDGRADLATANAGAGTVSVLMGDGAGHFEPQVQYGVGTTPRSVVPGDFNADGRQDLAVANFDSDTVSVLLGDGGGSFGMAFTVAAAAAPYLIASGDVNNDGDADLLVPNYDAGTVSVLIGDGAAHFTERASIATGTGPRHVNIVDINEDGLADLIVANRDASSISVLLGNGAGDFAQPLTFGVGAGPFFTVAADFNRDGHLDVHVVNRDGHSLSLLPGDGSGVFAAPVPLLTGRAPRGITAADFDGDGRVDLAMPGIYVNTVSILLGSGDGKATLAGSYPVSRSPWGITSGDYNGDGLTDVATTNSGANSVSVLLNSGAGAFAAARTFAAGPGAVAVVTTDLDNDGRQDLVTANASGNSISVLLGDGAGGFAAPVTRPTGATPNALAVSDFNADGWMDLVVSHGGGGNVMLLLGDGAGGFSSAVPYATPASPSAVAAADFDGDLRPDVAVASSSASVVKILLGDGAGALSAGGSFAVGSGPFGIAAADFDGDGVLDLATANGGANSVSVLRGTGGGTFGVASNDTAGLFSRALAIADFDADGRADIAVANANTNDAWILINTTGHGDLSVGISNGLGEVSPGQRIRYAVTVANHGPADVPGAEVSAVLPAGASDIQWSCAASSGSACGAPGASGVVADSPWVRKGGTVVYTIDVTIAADAAGSIEARGRVVMPPGDDPNLSNNEAVDVDSVNSNHAPVAQDASVTVAEDAAVGIVLGASDADSDPLTWRVVAGPAHGTLSGAAPSLTYTPAANFNGTDTFTFQANDGRADSNGATVSISVTPLNDAPTAGAVSLSTEEDTPLTVTLAGMDVDGDALTYTIESLPAHGSVSGSGAVRTYTPATGYRGPDSLAFTVSDGSAASAFAQVEITVTPRNHAPVLAVPIADVNVTDDSTVVDVDLSSAFTDPDIADGDVIALSVGANSNPSLVSPSFSGSVLRLGLAAGASGSATLRVRATDSHGLFVDDEFSLTVARPPLHVTLADASVVEGNSGTRSLIFTLSLSAPSTAPVAVSFTSADLSAAAGMDYSAVSGSVTFNPSVTTRSITVPVMSDLLDEADETVRVRLTSAAGADISRGEAVGTIVDDDVSRVSIGDVTVVEGDAGTTMAIFQVTMSPANSRAVTVDYATANSTGVAGLDYLATSGTLTLPAGTQSQTVEVPVNGDTLDEASEKFAVVLSNLANAVFQRGVGTATITDDDAPPTVSIDDAVITEGDGTTVARFTVRLSAPSGLTTRVQFATSNGTAFAGADYRSASGALTFTPGVTSLQVAVGLFTDNVAEPTETFLVTLSAPVALTIGKAQAVGTILDDDGAPNP